jgi:hypothetical protein
MKGGQDKANERKDVEKFMRRARHFERPLKHFWDVWTIIPLGRTLTLYLVQIKTT